MSAYAGLDPKDILNAAKTQRAGGASDAELRRNATASGLTEAEINEILGQLNTGSNTGTKTLKQQYDAIANSNQSATNKKKALNKLLTDNKMTKAQFAKAAGINPKNVDSLWASDTQSSTHTIDDLIAQEDDSIAQEEDRDWQMGGGGPRPAEDTVGRRTSNNTSGGNTSGGNTSSSKKYGSNGQFTEEAILQAIRDQRAAGASDAQLRRNAKASGLSDADIDDLLGKSTSNDTSDDDTSDDDTSSDFGKSTNIGKGVKVEGESGLRPGYAPYVQLMLEQASALADTDFETFTGGQPTNLKEAREGIKALTENKYSPTSFTAGSWANPQAGKRSGIRSVLSPQEVANQSAGESDVSINEYMRPKPRYSDKDRGIAPLITQPNTFEGPLPAGAQPQGRVLDTPEDLGMAKGGLASLLRYDAGGTVAAETPASVNYGGQNVSATQASYMDPYMQNVVDVQQREAKRQADIANQATGARAAQAGAFGGTRHGLVEAENQRNLAMQLGGIQAKGLQDAYAQGLGQFNTEQKHALDVARFNEASRQFGQNFDFNALRALEESGRDQRDFDYKEFLRGEKYPYENLRFMRDMLNNLPISASATGVDPTSQALSGGISAAALTRFFDDYFNNRATTSDRRLKTDIKPIGMFDDGLKIYSYRYKSGGPVQIGVMADEVAVLRPQAYIKGGAGDGFDAVDYSKL